MSISHSLLSLDLLLMTPEVAVAKPCDGKFEVTKEAYKFTDLPKEIYDDLLIYSGGFCLGAL